MKKIYLLLIFILSLHTYGGGALSGAEFAGDEPTLMYPINTQDIRAEMLTASSTGDYEALSGLLAREINYDAILDGHTLLQEAAQVAALGIGSRDGRHLDCFNALLRICAKEGLGLRSTYTILQGIYTHATSSRPRGDEEMLPRETLERLTYLLEIISN